MLTGYKFGGLFLLIAVWLTAAPVFAAAPQAVSAGLHLPQRLTAGGSNQMMGSLSADGKALYLVSDRDVTNEIFVQDPVESGPRLLFETNADAAQPRPSPDGRWLAYLSYKRDAAGDACLLELATGEHRCLTNAETADVALLWLDAGQHLAVLSRAGLHEDYRLLRFELGGGNTAPELILAKNISGPAVAPGKPWLAYVPLRRMTEQVGVAFANQSGERLELVRLGHAEEPVPFAPDLPGATGFPAFSIDGQTLYFSQYLNDTNGDGAIDGNDNSVLFRVAFDPAADQPITGFPEQLTSARWNCRYPTPAADRLVMTCSHQGSLDIYSLPLGGAVPPDWQPARVQAELAVARDHWSQLLLLGRLLTVAPDVAERIKVLKHMAVLHLELREYESALFYCGQIARLAGAQSEAHRWAGALEMLAAHRRADVALTHGQLSEEYIATELKRAEALRQSEGGSDTQVVALASIVESEILDDVGRKADGRARLEEVDLAGLTDPLVVRLYAHRARERLALLADGSALADLEQALAAHAALGIPERLHHGEQLVAELVRGVPHAERLARVEARLAGLSPDSEAGLMLRVYAWLLKLAQGADQEQVRAGLFDIYKANKDPNRRRALVLATVRLASRLGNEYLQYQFATSWASWLKRSDPERKYAEDLFQRVVLERAYEEWTKGKVSEARGYFFATTMQTDSLEAHTGFIEAFLAEGKGDLDQTYERRFKQDPGNPARAFVSAYRQARDLPAAGPMARRLRAIDGALGSLAEAARAWPQRYEIHHLWGHLLHQRYAISRAARDAESAYRHYLLALDLAREAPRTLAAVELAAGLLQSALGNHRLAEAHLRRRGRLPHVRPIGELAWRLALARCVFHTAEASEAVAEAERALALVAAEGKLARFRPLVLDRLALYSLAAGLAAKALETYRALLEESGKGAADLAWPINRIKFRLGLATAALDVGDHDLALAQLDAVGAVLDDAAPLRTVPEEGGADLRDSKRFEREDYRLLQAGLRAQALRAKGDLPAATAALGERRSLLAARLAAADVDEDLLEVARTDYHLAEVAYRSGQPAEAIAHLQRGLASSQAFNRRTGSGVNPVGLRLLQAYAEVFLAGTEGPPPVGLRKQLEAAYSFICKNRGPSWAAERFLFGNYLTLMDLKAGGG